MSDKKMVAVLIGIAAVLWFITSLFFTRTSSTNDIYLIPEGFEGDIRVNYNVQGAPALEKDGKYDVIPIRVDGTYDTSKPDMEYGLVTDQYFYVSHDHDGRRTPIDERCVHVRGNGSSEIGSSITRHNDLTITLTKCSEDFRAWGK
ncbi:hypothetical protein SAMN04487969_11294 [Paenibacillus algorifonticola]|uniref:DUF6843 domain-containing protein n=1 Tax=Paenibacillus algorifonticola TaxID=684063 RepID=A0A1I2FJS8_9BACL|nr:hypothetical protein [Paenibacillus algorifonticola]SFF04977.1 hypothetical protein SAMN04487969_11294 [Paenibacillus algorifonticola]